MCDTPVNMIYYKGMLIDDNMSVHYLKHWNYKPKKALLRKFGNKGH